MDSITHVALGAIVGEAIAGKSLGRHAMLLGAIGQSIPDIDFLAALWLPATDNLLAHRGFTHSFLFGALATCVCVAIARRVYRPRNVPIGVWFIFWGTEILLHLLLDACNAYGVGWLEPFGHQRFSFHLLFVADPFFSFPLGVAMIALLVLDSKKTATRRMWIWGSLLLTAGYFGYAISNKAAINRDVRRAFAAAGIQPSRFFTTPTPLNTWLWFVVAEADSGFHTAYRSNFDPLHPQRFSFFPQRKDLLDTIRRQRDVQQLVRFSQGYYTVEEWGDTLVFNDLRFGQIAGWDNPEAKFVFHYYLDDPAANLLVIQRGRFSNWNRKTMGSMIDRIRGRQSPP